jgi:hypothetical protein
MAIQGSFVLSGMRSGHREEWRLCLGLTLATGASQLDSNHPANLLEAFPRPLDLDSYLWCTAIAGLTFAVFAGFCVLGERNELLKVRAVNRAYANSLRERLAGLMKNQAEVASLRNEAPDTPGFLPGDRYPALRGLADAIPDSLTLTSFSIAKDDAFEIEALLVGTEFESDSVRQSLIRSGFVPGPGSAWIFDAAARRLSVRGKYGYPKP